MCRSRVTSWLRLYISLVFGMAGALSEGNTTMCHYQVNSGIQKNSSIQSIPRRKENDVTKACELFHKVGCQNISYSPRTCEGCCELGKMNGQPYYYLTISTLWSREGFLGVNGTDDCWKFKVGNASDHEKHIIMDLTFFPKTSLKNILIYRDGGRCDYLYSSKYSLRQMRENESLAFTLTPAPSVREVKLIVFSGDCEVNCSGSENNCDLFPEEHTMKDFSKPLLIPVLLHRYHCIRVEHGDCDFSTVTVKKEDPPPPPTPRPNDESVRPVVIWSSIAVVAVILVVIFLKTTYTCGSFLREPSDTRHAEAPTPWPSSPTLQKVLLLYSRDCPQFCEVARALGQLLQSFGNLKVLDPLQQNEMERVSENISGWLTQHLQSPDVKLVIVVSEGAMLRQNALLNNQLVHNDEPHFLDPMFTLALQQMHERPQLGNDYKRIFPVRFEDFTPSEVSLSLIVPLKCYVLQRHLGKLIAELGQCNAAPETGYEDIQRICPQEVSQLESAIRDMKSYCADNPHYLKDHFSVVSR